MMNSPRPLRSHPVLRAFLILLAVIIVILAACEIAGWPFLQKPAEKFLSEKLERIIRFDGPFRLHFLGGLKFKAGGIFVSAPDGFDAPHFVQAKDAELRLRYKDLIGLKPGAAYRIKSIRVGAIDARLMRHQDGKATWDFKKEEDNEPPRPFPIIENLVVSNGTAVVKDEIAQADLQLKFDTNEGASTAESKTQSNVEMTGKLRDFDLKGKLITYGFLPIAEGKSNTAPIKSKGWVEYGGLRADFDGSVANAFGEQNIKGKLSIKGPSLSLLGDLVNTVLPTTSAFSMSAEVNKDSELWQVTVTSARIGSSSLTGQFKYDLRPEVPLLEGDIRGTRFILADLGPAFGTRSETGEKVRPATGRVIPDRPLNLPSLNKMNARISLNLDYVELGSAFQRPIAPFKANLKLDQGNLGLADIDARTADGALSGQISVDAHKLKEAGVAASSPNHKLKPDQIPVWRIDLVWKNINLAKWLQVSEARKQKAREEGKKEPQPYITGILNGRTKLAGKGESTAELLGSLNGDVSMYVQNGSLSHLVVELLGIDIAQSIGVLIKGDTELPMQCAVMDFKANEGIIKPNVAMVDTPVTLVLVDGNVNMAKEKLDLTVAAKPKNVSPFTARSPIKIQGTFVKPDVSIEKGPIAARIAGGIALAFVNPLAAIIPFIDPGSDAKSSPCLQALAQDKTRETEAKVNTTKGKPAAAKAR